MPRYYHHVPIIGFLDWRSPEALIERLRGFRQGLKEAVTRQPSAISCNQVS